MYFCGVVFRVSQGLEIIYNYILMFTVKVIETSTGRPVKGARVGAAFEGFSRGCTKDEYTDSDGEAHFDYDNGTGIIYVNGHKEYEGRIEGRRVVYI